MDKSKVPHFLWTILYTMMDDCLQTGKQSWYIINTKVKLTVYFFLVGKSSTSLLEQRWAFMFTCVRWHVVLCDFIWQMIIHSSEIGLL